MKGEALISELLDFCTRSAFTYFHKWAIGDVLIWDQQAVLHRVMPWPYNQLRTLVSLRCSTRESDGLAAAREAVR